MLQEHHTHVVLALDCGLVERGVTPIVAGVGVGPGPQEERHNLGMAERASVVQGDEAAVVSGVDIGSSV